MRKMLNSIDRILKLKIPTIVTLLVLLVLFPLVLWLIEPQFIQLWKLNKAVARKDFDRMWSFYEGKNYNPFVRREAIRRWLEEIDDPNAITVLLKKGLQDDYVISRIIASPYLNNPSVISVLKELLNDSSYPFREHIIDDFRQYANSYCKSFLPDIIQFLKDKNMREIAYGTLFLITNRSFGYTGDIKLLPDNRILTSQDGIISDIKQISINYSAAYEEYTYWWNTNGNYLYWSEEEDHFVVDEEAKAAGIPTEEYRKTHPWPIVR
jgi:hypothetical protein